MAAQAKTEPAFDGKGLLTLYASLERGNQLVSSGPDLPSAPSRQAVDRYLSPRKQALELWKKGLRFRNDDSTLAKEIATRVEAVSIGAANELKQQSRPFVRDKKWSEEIAMLTAGIEMLKLAKDISRTDRVVLTVAALLVERGQSHRQTGDGLTNLTSAINDFEEALTLSPTDDNIKQQTAWAYNTRGCNTENRNSMADFTRAIELYPQALLYVNRAVEYLKVSNYDRALEDLAEACQRESKPEYVKMAASAYNAKGMSIINKYQHGYGTPSAWELREARDCFANAMQLDPSNSTFRSNYVTVAAMCH
jgi:tetratricopeptide (TPR) repeat protein